MFGLPSRALRRGALAIPTVATLLGAAAWHPPAVQDGRIVGFVRDPAGRPVRRAEVRVLGTRLTAVADTLGAYQLAHVPVGTYRLQARALGYVATNRDRVIVRSGATTIVDLIMPPAPAKVEELVAASSADAGAQPAAELRLRGYQQQAQQGGRSLGARQMVKAAKAADPDWNTENYAVIEESRFLPALDNPRSTFSIDVDAGSYTNVRRFLTGGQRPPKDAVRIEELLNYFRYDYPEPRGTVPFSVTTDVATCPWAPEHRLLRIGIKGKSLDTERVPPSNLVFLIDVSGSMATPDKLPLVKQALRLLVQELRPEDRVAIAVYAGAAGLVLPPTSGGDKAAILSVLDRLEAGGSTAGGAGLRLAYDVAKQYYNAEGNNRVILATDGDFNIGESSDAAMVRLIEQRRDQGIFLTVLGFGTGNLKDTKMEQIADKGNGNYAYVDNLREARRLFVREFSGTLVTIAKDVKIQVEFNPAKVAAYRLVGYENRALRNEDFADDKKDAGELGAGHTVTALYELVPVGASTANLGLDSLRYQQVSVRPTASRTDEWLTVQLRYKPPAGTRSQALAVPVRVRKPVGSPSGDFGFAAAVAEFGLVLRDSEFKGHATIDQVLALARNGEGADPDGERAEFVQLVESARALAMVETGRSPDGD